MVEYLIIDTENGKDAVVVGKTKQEAIDKAFEIIHGEYWDSQYTKFYRKEEIVSKNYKK